MTAPAYTFVQPGQGTSIELGLGRPVIKVGFRDGAAQISVFESELPPGGGFRVPHWHVDFDEIFYVLDGEIEYLLDREWQSARAGSTIYVHAGTVHAFRNASNRAARHLVIGPAELVELITELEGTHPDQWEEIHKRHNSFYARSQQAEPSSPTTGRARHDPLPATRDADHHFGSARNAVSAPRP